MNAAERRVLVIDVGSNTIRAVAADISPSGEAVIDYQGGGMTALGGGLSETGAMSSESIAATVDMVTRMVSECLGIDQTHCVGTAACRDASNTEVLVRALRENAGVELEVISGELEAEFSHAGAIDAVGESCGAGSVVIDIGGASTELVRRHGATLDLTSLPIGARSLTETCLRSDPPTDGEVRDACAAAREVLVEAMPMLREATAAVATGGTAHTAARCLNRWVLSAARLRELVCELSGVALADRRELLPSDPARAAVIVGGLVILEAIAAEAPGQRVGVSRGGLREGVLLTRAGATTVRVA